MLGRRRDGWRDRAATHRPRKQRANATTDTELATQTYVAGYPLVVSVRTLQRLGGLVGVNRLFWQNALAGPQSRTIVAPNRDTLYSIAVLDLRAEPMVLTLPEVTDRYFTYQFLDAWTESFAYVGTRATGGRSGTWVITPPGWDGELPAGVDRIEATTPQVFLLGRFLVQDEADIANVTAISEQTSLRPLSGAHRRPRSSTAPAARRTGRHSAGHPRRRRLLRRAGRRPGDQRADDRRRARSSPGPRRSASAPVSTRPSRAPARTVGATWRRRRARRGRAAGHEQIVEGSAALGQTDSGWSANLHIGRYGDDTLLRAAVARVGWGANVAAEAVYPVARVDDDGNPLDGSATYRITFPAGAAAAGRRVLVAVGLRRRHVLRRARAAATRSATARRASPSATTVRSRSSCPTTSRRSPKGRAVNWLPVPAGRFVLMLRLYLPGPAVLDGD